MTARTMTATAKPRARIAAAAVYRLDMTGEVLGAFERTLFVRPDGEVVTVRVATNAGRAHLTFVLHARRSSWRISLARRLLGIGR